MTTTLGVSFSDDELEERVQAGVDRVEERLQGAVRRDERFVAEITSHLLNAGGKRFRPLLTLLAAEFGDAGRPQVVEAAAVVELTHLATLYHDDVMDEAPKRRGAQSANARWDNSLAILAGDYLFALASDIVADLGPEAVHVQARTFSRLVRGQIHETLGPAEGDDALRHYLDVVADKTGSLIAASALMGARESGASEDVQQTLAEFGERIGVAFQLADDVLDLAADSETSGKTPGTDLREGVPTLPTLIAQGSTDPADARLRELLSRPLTDDAEHAEALGLLRSHRALGEARAHVRAEADAARALLDKLPDVPAREALSALCDVVADRLA